MRVEEIGHGHFVYTVEVVPPAGGNAEPLLRVLGSVAHLPFDAFSVATNPLAKPRMSALALSALIQQRTGKPAILHCTTRDHNRLSLQALLWGARALGIETVLVSTGDFVALREQKYTTTVGDLDVFALVELARQAGMQVGVVFDPRPESDGLEREARRLKEKAAHGAQFAVTQPVYDRAVLERIAEVADDVGIPVLLGVLPLRSWRHAAFLHFRVAGIAVPEVVRERMRKAPDPVAEGIAQARQVLAWARERFAGACLMPPFGHYEILWELLGEQRTA